METVHHRFAMVDGHTVYYREAGVGNTRNILLLHGAPASSFMFRDLIPILAKNYHVLAPDYLGFGLSDDPSADDFDYTFDNLTTGVEALLSQLEFHGYAMYVQDYGAPVGWRLALRNPADIAAIITQNGNAYEEGFVPGFWQPLWAYAQTPTPQTEAPLRDSLTQTAIKWQYLHGVDDPTLVSPDTWVHDTAAVQRPGNAEIQLALYRDYPSNRTLYPAVHEYFRQHQPPALIVWGENDEIFHPNGARAFLEDLPNAQLHLLDGGHFLLESHLAHTAQLILHFLEPVWNAPTLSHPPVEARDLAVRPATASDLPFIVRGERSYIRSIEPGQESSWTNALDGNLALWVENLERTKIAEIDDDIVGYVMWTHDGADAVLVTISVLPQYRQRGIGRRLLNRFVVDATAAGARLLKGGVQKDNPAWKLYDAAGFEPAGMDDDYLFFSMHGAAAHITTEPQPVILPPIVSEYLTRSRSSRPGTAIDLLSAEATITDNGTTYTGPAQITAFLEDTEFDFTSQLVGTSADDGIFTAITRLDGNFPGGTVTLHYQFALDDSHSKIRRIDILA